MRRLLPSFLAALAGGLVLRGAEPTQPTVAVFAVPQPGHIFSFPRDHGSHPDFKLEWWYLTGHLFAADGRRFGFQATFFRQASPDGTTQIYLAHMALVDVQTGRFIHQERLNRGGWDAAASAATLDVHNGPWSLRFAPTPATSEGAEKSPLLAETMELRGGVRNEALFRLTLSPTKPLVRFGDGGYSRKGAEPSAASYYLTFPRLALTGELTLGADAPFTVSGEAWMDHEISSSQLSGEQVGWDWLSVHLHGQPQRELMLYRMRRRDGSDDPASTLQWVTPTGVPSKQPFTWKVLSRWKSPLTHADYPARVQLTTTDPDTGAAVRFTIEPLYAAQELAGAADGIAYWEGACRVLDENGRDVGSAYMELTGYAAELKL